MSALFLHEFHHGVGANFADLGGHEIVADYGDFPAEHAALRQSAGVLDLSFRSRLCVTGADRVRFLHGQVTNDVKRLGPGQGRYAALVSAKGKMESDLNIFCLPEELLLDFEPGLTDTVSRRLEKHIVADDAQVVDVAAHCGLLSVQGPRAEAAVCHLEIFAKIPSAPLSFSTARDATLGELYLMSQPRLGFPGFDLVVPAPSLGAVADKLIAAAKRLNGRACGWRAFETARVEAGLPRFGADMDASNFPQECGIEARAVSYSKGCYIGQEILNRIHTVGHVTKLLRGLRLADDLATLPVKGDALLAEGKPAGYVTSAVKSPALGANIALGYVRREAGARGTRLTLHTAAGPSDVTVVDLPVGGDARHHAPARFMGREQVR